MTTSEKQMEFLTELCSLNLQDRRRWLAARLLKEFGSRVYVQALAAHSSYSRDRSCTNFVVRFGRHAERLVVGAHYDVVEHGDVGTPEFVPGANDNGAAVTQLFFAALQLQEEGNEPDVTFVFFDHEEWFGSPDMGSHRYLQTNPRPELAIVLDVTGIGNLYWSTSQTALRVAWHQVLLSGLRGKSTPPSDSMNFISAGIPTVLLCCLPEQSMVHTCPLEWGFLHSCEDDLKSITPDSLPAVSLWVVATIYRFGELRKEVNLVDTLPVNGYPISVGETLPV